jgi:mono/diheme cytochrome c family protein
MIGSYAAPIFGLASDSLSDPKIGPQPARRLAGYAGSSRGDARTAACRVEPEAMLITSLNRSPKAPNVERPMIRNIAMVAVVSSLVACAGIEVVPPLYALSGKQLYERLCASCHGNEGHGDGPVAALIKIGVPDLTRLAARAGGQFPTEEVHRVIDGRSDRPAHGSRDMPVWGWRLYDLSNPNYVGARADTDSMIDQLVVHLQSIQGL